MIRILSETSNGSSDITVKPLEKLHFRSTLGASFRHYDGIVEGATVQFTTLADGQVHCEVEVDAGLTGVLTEATETSRTSAFMAATESLDRLLFRAIHHSPGMGDIVQFPDRLAS